jgi:hypothetical protein
MEGWGTQGLTNIHNPLPKITYSSGGNDLYIQTSKQQQWERIHPRESALHLCLCWWYLNCFPLWESERYVDLFSMFSSSWDLILVTLGAPWWLPGRSQSEDIGLQSIPRPHLFHSSSLGSPESNARLLWWTPRSSSMTSRRVAACYLHPVQVVCNDCLQRYLAFPERGDRRHVRFAVSSFIPSLLRGF